MSARDDITIPFEPGQAYHLFNRGINRQPIFFLKGNQEYFLNKQEKRTGSLFQKTIRRKRITSHAHLKSACAYIHRNPIHHGYVAHAEDYLWCSYQLWTNPKAIENPNIINCYDSIDEMRQYLESSTDNWEESFG